MIHEIRQPLWFSTPFGEARSLFLIDYGPEDDLIWVCVQQEGDCTGQIWSWHNSEVRMLPNRTVLRAEAHDGS